MSNNPSTLNLTIDDAVTEIHFTDSSTQGTDETDVINIVGFKDDVIRFGTDATGLTVAQLATITADGVAIGRELKLSAKGYLQAGDILSVDDNETIDFNVYPNPITDVLTINTNGDIESIQIFDQTGRSVLRYFSSHEEIDISHFTSGMYILKLTSKNGIKTQSIVKQ